MVRKRREVMRNSDEVKRCSRVSMDLSGSLERVYSMSRWEEY